MQWSGNLGEGWNEPSIIAHKAKEGADLLGGSGSGPILDSARLLRVCRNSLAAHDVSKVFDLPPKKLALLGLQLEAMALEAFEDLLQVLKVCGKVWGVDNDIVKID